MPWSAPTSPWLQNGVPKDPRELLIVCSQPKYARSIICTYASKMDFILQQMGGQQFSATLTSGFENPIPLNPHWFIIIFFQKKKLCGVNPPIFQPQPEIFLRLHSEGPQSGPPVAPEAEAPAGRRRRHRSTPPNSSGFQWFLDVLGTEIGRFFIEIWGNQKRGTLK